MRVLITGACGFLARELANVLQDSHDLILLDRNRPEDATMFLPGVSERHYSPFDTKHPFVQAEIVDEAAIGEAMRGVDAVVHLAASVTGLPEQGVETFSANALGTFVVLDAARLAGVKRFLCASSINAFGTIYWRISGKPIEYTSMPLTEGFKPVPEDPYSLSKYVNEETCAAFSRAYDITTAAFRFAGVWTDAMYQKALSDGLAPTQAWSDDVFQWVHVKDIACGIRQAFESPDLPLHGVYTLGASDTRCPEATVEILNIFRPDLAARITESLPGRAALMSIRRAREAFGYDPQYRLAE